MINQKLRLKILHRFLLTRQMSYSLGNSYQYTACIFIQFIIMFLSQRVILSVYHILVCLILIAVFAVFSQILKFRLDLILYSVVGHIVQYIGLLFLGFHKLLVLVIAVIFHQLGLLRHSQVIVLVVIYVRRFSNSTFVEHSVQIYNFKITIFFRLRTEQISENIPDVILLKFSLLNSASLFCRSDYNKISMMSIPSAYQQYF